MEETVTFWPYITLFAICSLALSIALNQIAVRSRIARFTAWTLLLFLMPDPITGILVARPWTRHAIFVLCACEFGACLWSMHR